MEEIPPRLILNWDQTGLNLVPSSNWTMERKGTILVKLCGLKDKRMITGIFCGNLNGEMLPFQLIYGGKTTRCHPSKIQFPEDWDITQNLKHWSNETSMLCYIHNVIVSFVERVREELGEPKDKPALAIFDCFRGQLTANIVMVLEENNKHSVIVPPNCTDKLQPLDLTVNKAAKSFLQNEFRDWYATEVSKQMRDGTLSPVDLSTSRMKCIGATSLIRSFEYLENNPHLLVNGFHSACIPQSIDTGQPIITTDLIDSEDDNYTDRDNDSDDDTDNENESDN